MRIYFRYSQMPINGNLPVLRICLASELCAYTQQKAVEAFSCFRWAQGYSDNLVEIKALCIICGWWRNGGMVEVFCPPQEKAGFLPMTGMHSPDRTTPHCSMKVRLCLHSPAHSRAPFRNRILYLIHPEFEAMLASGTLLKCLSPVSHG